MSARKALIHIGTHKTGTKSIQLYTARNVDVLREIGLYLPNAGRVRFDENAASPGHHDLAIELSHGRREQLDALIAEIQDAGRPDIFLSSEEFHPLTSDPAILSPLRDALANAGYETIPIVYLRDQATYATSLYAELTKGHYDLPLPGYLRSILDTARFAQHERYVIHFEYSRLLLELAAIFGEDRIVVRPFTGGQKPEALIGDMVRVLATFHPAIRSAALSNQLLAVNTRSTFRDVLTGIYRAARIRYPNIPDVDALAKRMRIDAADPRFLAPFTPLDRDERVTFVRRFAEDNARVETMTNLILPGTREEDLAAPADPQWSRTQWQREVLDIMTDVWLR